jgi:hypothetical protein
MTTLIVVAICVAALLYFTQKKPPGPSGPAMVASQSSPPPFFDPSMFAAVKQVEPSPDRRMQLLSRKLQEVSDERLMNDTLDDLGIARVKSSRPAAVAVSG